MNVFKDNVLLFGMEKSSVMSVFVMLS